MWEYLEIVTDRSRKIRVTHPDLPVKEIVLGEDFLFPIVANLLGEDGWEMVSFSKTLDNQGYLFVFKRHPRGLGG